ncbi:helix-turn-helix transcriptional regulator [Roseobacteraceae bacterium NS-SX3]
MSDPHRTGPDDRPMPAAAQDDAVAELISAIGTSRFPAAMRRLIAQGCKFQSMVITEYPGTAPPRALYHDLDDVQAAITVQFYASGPYLLDPLYQACQAQAVPGVYRLPELVTEAFFRSEYYRTFYRKIRISDEIGILIRQPAGGWIIVSLARAARQPRFSEADADAASAIFQTISAAVLKHWNTADQSQTGAEEAMLEDRLESFGADVLSPREAQIVRLVLRGHSTPSAAAFLGISEGTVKVHRHNAYSKLGVSSQAELFSMAARHFMAAPD